MVSAAMGLEEYSPIPLPTGDGAKSEEQMNTTTDDFAPKVRKPYTITKQRERWTDDEHKKFIEALKLYGRAWRKIEEHIRTKTAVQIRSHAQKFFSKVVRESNATGGNGSSVKPSEIPPPRPKRKPMHPYPRKLVSSLKTKSTSPEPDNQSPMSVLSAVGSDSSTRAESTMPTGSPSSVSSVVVVCDPETHKFVFEGSKFPLPSHPDEILSSDECIPPPVPVVSSQQELEVSSRNTVFVQEDRNESTTQSLKLFGKTLVIVDPRNQSELALEFPTQNDPLYMQMTSPMDGLPWLTLCSSSTEVHSATPMKARPMNNEQKEKVTANRMLLPSSCKLTALGECSRKGFVPYKRCLPEQEKSSEEREQKQQRIRVCL